MNTFTVVLPVTEGLPSGATLLTTTVHDPVGIEYIFGVYTARLMRNRVALTVS